MKNNQLTLRLALPGESTQLADLAEQAYGKYRGQFSAPPAPLMLDYAAVAASGRTYVAVESHDVLGMVTIEPDGSHLILRNLAVHPSCQGRGIGSQLVSLVENLAREGSMGAVRLWTRLEMRENIAFYLRLNYTVTHCEQNGQASRIFFLKTLL